MSSTASINIESQEIRLERLRREVESLREQLRRAQRLASLGTVTAMVAHEFNNILTPITNYARLAQENQALAEKALARAAEGGARAEAICSAILGFAVDKNAPSKSEFRQVSVLELVGRTIRATARDPSKDKIEITTDIPAELTLSTRPVELQQVMFNLLLNARRSIMRKQPPRRIHIYANHDDKGKSIRIGVSDNGVGIPPENMERIFQPFFSTGSSDDNDESGGCGLGLPVCREIVTSLGGEITADSTPGRGATFTVCLPCD